MALATKCPKCGAMFRVVADQLKLRGGLVRCGQCRTVFDAIGSLAYVDDTALTVPRAEAALVPSDGPATPQRDVTSEVSPSVPPPAAAPRPRSAPAGARESADRKRKALGPATTLRIAPGAAPVATVSLEIPPREPPGSQDSPAAAAEDQRALDGGVPTLLAPGAAGDSEERVSRAALDGIEVIEVTPPAEAESAALAPDAEEPEFIRSARRPSRQGFSIFFTGGALLLALLAVAQAMVILRSEVMVQWPSARPALMQLCQVFGCKIEWPTQPDQLAVIGSELQSIAGTDVLELSTVIRNRAGYTQALPALEVTLSDTQNRPVARKVFSPADYLAAAGEPSSRIDEGLAAGADMTIRLFFETRGLQVAGFLVYPFYR
jgi:predicted Zn finger-like uncharacterized protein